MTIGLNIATLLGNVGKDPELRTTKDGKQMAVFSLATTDSWKDKSSGEKKERTEWHRIVVFQEGLVSVIKNYVHKGSKLYIQGNLQKRKWLDDSGIEKEVTEVVLQNQSAQLILLEGRNSEKMYSDDNESQGSTSTSVEDDEIPFN